MKTAKFPITVTESGVTAKIYKARQSRNGQEYGGFIVAYSLLGKRKQVWRAKLDDAEAVAADACQKIANGEQLSLTLTNGDRMTYLRASEALVGVHVPIDTACREYATAFSILSGRSGLIEVCRDWIKRNATELPKITVAKAVEEIQTDAKADGKSHIRQKQLSTLLGRFAKDLNVHVHEVTPDLISRWLSGLALAERTRRNFRDVIGFFCRFCVRRGYVAKGTDWLEGVQNYAARKIGTIEIFTPDEITKLLRYGERHVKDMVTFLSVGAFAGLRQAEIGRLDWTEVELSETPGESFIEVKSIEGTKSDQRRRLVPVKDNLKAWLLRYRKTSGPVCRFKNITKQLLKLARGAGVEWKHNGLRHSCISYRVAESGDVPRVSDESGNSVTVIRSNYLRCVKPAVATEWFGIMPGKRRQK